MTTKTINLNGRGLVYHKQSLTSLVSGNEPVTEAQLLLMLSEALVLKAQLAYAIQNMKQIAREENVLAAAVLPD
jgi:hypothetical protein